MIAGKRKDTLKHQIKKKFFLMGVVPFIVINILGVIVSFFEIRIEVYKQLALTREYVRNQFLENFRDRIKDAHNLLESSAAVNLAPLIANVSSENLRKMSKNLLSNADEMKLNPAETALTWLKNFRQTNGYEEILYVSHSTQRVDIAVKNFHYIGRKLNSEDDEFRVLNAAYDQALDRKGVYVMDQALLLPGKGAYVTTVIPLYNRAKQAMGVFFLFYAADNFTELTLPARKASESMEIYAVGHDYYFRSGSRFIANAPMNEKAVTSATLSGINHESGTEIITDYRGTKVLSSFSHVGLNEELGLDFDWVLLSEIDVMEAFSSLFFLTLSMFIITLLLITFNLLISKSFAREISEPLSRFSHIFRNMSQGKPASFKGEPEKYAEFLQLSQAFNSLADTFSGIEGSMDELSRGNTAIRMDKNDRHPIMKSIHSVILSLNEYSERAKEIASGDYDIEIKPRSESDRLGNSLLKMTESLRRKQKSLEESEWQRNGRIALAEIAGDFSDIENMANDYILFFTRYLGGRSGLFYVINPDSNYSELVLAASFGVPNSYAPRKRIQQNDGIMGDMLHPKAEIHLTGQPEENYFGFGSGLGESKEGTIVAVPFILKDTPVGAMEILFPGDVPPESLNLIKENSDIVTSSLVRVLEGAKVRNLLEKTSSQAEELQAQQEELRVTNEELAEKNVVLEDQKKNIEKTNQSLEVMAGELAQKAEELQKTNRYKSEFLANMSHELRTPLNSLLLLSSKLEKNRDGNLTERQVQSLSIIHQSGNDLLTLINGILDLAKIEAGRMEVNFADTAIATLVKDIENTFRHAFDEKKIDFEITVDPNLPGEINTDPQKLIQILRNLISNALKFTSKGKVEARFELSNIDGEPALRIAVRDTGTGIAEEKLSLIFEAFRQADGSTARVYGGTGLGLTISKEFIKQLSGRIEVESKAGAGSEFRVFIPYQKPGAIKEAPQIAPPSNSPILAKGATPKPPSKSEAQDKANRAAGGQKTALIIEDDTGFANILIDLCKSRGFRCLYASDGASGLQISKTHELDAILLDLKLPDMSGEEVLDQLKSDAKTANIPVQVISGKSKGDTLLQKGAIGYLKKPVTEEEILEALEHIQEITEPLGRILILEKESKLNELMAEKYTEPVNIDFATDSRKAMSLLTRNDYNCMILDIDQEGFDPFDFFHKVSLIKKSLPPAIIYTEKELTEEEHLKLNKFAKYIVLKSGDSIRRLHDESMLFLSAVKRDEAHTFSQPLPSKDEKKTPPLNILAVDDDMRNLFAISEELEEEGHKVDKASNGLRALEHLKEADRQYDLILTDIMMPEMNGYDTMREIRKLKGYKKTPIIALTAKAMKGDRDICIEAGATDYLAKPLNREKLLAMIAKVTE